MTVTLKCAKCGAENRLGQLFCRECGAKLDMSKLKPGDVHSDSSSGIGTRIFRIFRTAVSVIFIGTLGLLCWGLPAPGDAPTAQGSRLVQAKMGALRGAIMRNNDIGDEFPEADINGHLNSMLAGRGEGSGPLSMKLRDVNVDLRYDEATVWMKANLGPLPLTYTVVVRAKGGLGTPLQFTAGAVRLGHVQLPGFLRDRAIQQFIGVFSALNEERTLINRLGQVQLIDGAVKVRTVRN